MIQSFSFPFSFHLTLSNIIKFHSFRAYYYKYIIPRPEMFVNNNIGQKTGGRIQPLTRVKTPVLLVETVYYNTGTGYKITGIKQHSYSLYLPIYRSGRAKTHLQTRRIHG